MDLLMVRSLLLVALGGGIGSMLRFLTSFLTNKYYASSFPLATFITNVLGCLLIGILMGSFDRSGTQSSELKFLLVTGFCGGYTTFSAFSYENIKLLQSGQTNTALAYMALSLVTGLLATWAGLLIART